MRYPERLLQWKINSGLVLCDDEILEQRLLCEKHFRKCDIYYNSKRKVLRKGAVPIPFDRIKKSTVLSDSSDEEVHDLREVREEVIKNKEIKKIRTYFNPKKRVAEELEETVQQKERKEEKIEDKPSTSSDDSHVQKKSRNETQNESLCVKIKGNRVISIQYYFDQLKKIASHNIDHGCMFYHLKIQSEKTNGFDSKIHIRCDNCMDVFKITLTDPAENMNKCIVNKDFHNSMGYMGLKKVFDSVQVPMMNEKTYIELLKRQSILDNQIFIKDEPLDIKTEYLEEEDVLVNN